MNKILMSNRKLRKNKIYSFALPAVKTCPMAGKCKEYCYASKGCYNFRQVKDKRQRNYKLSLTDNFIPAINYEISHKRTLKYVRIHDSGDFYNQEYLNKWVTIAQSNPDIIFYAYTKSLHLDFSKLPSNFKIIQSFGGLLDSYIDMSKPVAYIFNDVNTLNNLGFTDCHDSDLLAIYSDKVGLIAH